MIGELLGHYRVLELVGRGAMGVVYKALDENLDRTVAVKVMSAEARNDPDFVERFRLEARVQAALNHPNVALLFDYFVHDGAPVAVMEFIDGESLEQLIRRRGAIAAHEAIPVFKQALRGVAAAHRAGIVHRDLKPGNLMVAGNGIVKVMDFGIAKRQGVTGATKVSTSIGSPLYMAPEQILGRAVDCRTDIYALGITLYELLAGQRPFNSRGKAEYLVLDAHVNDLPEPPTVYRFGIPQPIVDAVMRSLAKDPDARFQSAEDFMAALPDMPAPAAVAPQRVSTGTVAIRGPTGTLPLTPRAPASAPPLDPSGSMTIDFSVGTVWDQLHPPAPPAPSSSATLTAPASPHASAAAAARASQVLSRPPRPRRLLRIGALTIGALLLAALAVRAVVFPEKRDHEIQNASATNATAPAESGGAPPSDAVAPPPEAVTPAAVPATAQLSDAVTPAVRSPTARHDLSGTWSGDYVDASGRQLLAVVSLSISRVYDDGGVEGSLRYRTASGEGECKLHRRGSIWSAGARRLQLSPESCSPHYPRELGVPLDFAGVNPRANTLKDGRIEAPTGEIIRVRLKRMSGV
jgi:serine/threonine protein kinase